MWMQELFIQLKFSNSWCEQGTAPGDIATDDPPSDLTFSVPALSNTTPDAPPPSPDAPPPSPDAPLSSPDDLS